MELSWELFGSFPSIIASTESFSKQCEAVTGGAFGLTHSCAPAPWPIRGKLVTRKRAAPIGMRVSDSTGESDLTGLGWSFPTRLNLSASHAAIFLPRARNSIGTVAGSKGLSESVARVFTTSNDFAGVLESIPT